MSNTNCAKLTEAHRILLGELYKRKVALKDGEPRETSIHLYVSFKVCDFKCSGVRESTISTEEYTRDYLFPAMVALAETIKEDRVNETWEPPKNPNEVERYVLNKDGLTLVHTIHNDPENGIVDVFEMCGE